MPIRCSGEAPLARQACAPADKTPAISSTATLSATMCVCGAGGLVGGKLCRVPEFGQRPVDEQQVGLQLVRLTSRSASVADSPTTDIGSRWRSSSRGHCAAHSRRQRSRHGSWIDSQVSRTSSSTCMFAAVCKLRRHAGRRDLLLVSHAGRSLYPCMRMVLRPGQTVRKELSSMASCNGVALRVK